jgi:Na+/H+ antiporter NhaD/arsenite permease-like protein
MLSLVILAIVFLLIAIRQVGNIRLQIWQIMLGGAVAVLLTGEIAPAAAVAAINLDVIIFLFCMFLLGQALEESGYLQHLAFSMFRRAKSTDGLVLLVLFGIGTLSAFLMNDTLAIIGTPVVLLMARRHKMSSKLLLLSLCFAVTIGSIMSPIGNPQNLLVAFELENPFVTFLSYLFIPTLLCLLAAYAVLRIFYRKEFHNEPLVHMPEAIKDERLALLCKLSLLLLLSLICAKIILVSSGIEFRITYIAIFSVIPLLFVKDRRIITRIDWQTLVFFAAMFVLMEAVWLTGVFSTMPDLTVSSILAFSVLVSQLISNVPLVALFLPLVSGTNELVALAAGATIAGNLFILGAASNVIIIQNAEKRGETITFWEFARVGVPLTVLNALILWAFL